MCDALSGIDLEDPSLLWDAAMGIVGVAENEDFASISEAQLESAMKEKCPDGWAVFEETNSRLRILQ